MKDKIITIVVSIIIALIITIVSGMFIYSIVEQVSYGEHVGKIVDKQYSAGYSYTETTTSYIGNDTIRIPTTKYREAQYLLKLEKEVDGKKKNIWIEVPESEYQKYQIGYFYGE